MTSMVSHLDFEASAAHRYGVLFNFALLITLFPLQAAIEIIIYWTENSYMANALESVPALPNFNCLGGNDAGGIAFD